MLPMRCEKKTRPPMQIRKQNKVSPLRVLVTIFCPYELHITKKVLTPTPKMELISISNGTENMQTRKGDTLCEMAKMNNDAKGEHE